VVVHGSGFPTDAPPAVRVGGHPAMVAFVSPTRMVVLMPAEAEGENLTLEIENDGATRVEAGVPWATGLHQVDNPAFDPEGRLYVTYSGPRGQEAPVSVFRVATPGAREPFVSGIVNATSLAYGPDGQLYISSRFDGAVYRVGDDGTHTQVASELLNGNSNMAAIAAQVGYDSEAAFSRAFKKMIGVAPSVWRQGVRLRDT